jgi:hypothetical protein
VFVIMSVIDKIYNALGIDTNNKVDKLLFKLQEKPKPDKGKNMPHIQVYAKGSSQQADLLYMPEDKGYKYILVVVDLATGITDAQPLRKKTPEAVLNALKKIYKRPYLNIPLDFFGTDPGSEFKGVVKRYMNHKGVIMKYGRPGRHRQQAMVESRNYMLGKVLNTRMLGQELLSNETSREWVADLPRVIETLNKYIKTKPKKSDTPSPHCKGNACNLLDKGTKVRVVLDEPRNIQGEKLHGGFRAGDIHFSPQIRTIEQIYLRPGEPPTYRVSGIPNVAYTKNQLQKVNPSEKAPGKSVLRKHFVEKIIDKEKRKGKIYYLVKWVGWDKPTWEPRATLIKDIPQLIKNYEDNTE